jgi:hypothetical protein
MKLYKCCIKWDRNADEGSPGRNERKSRKYVEFLSSHSGNYEVYDLLGKPASSWFLAWLTLRP